MPGLAARLYDQHAGVVGVEVGQGELLRGTAREPADHGQGNEQGDQVSHTSPVRAASTTRLFRAEVRIYKGFACCLGLKNAKIMAIPEPTPWRSYVSFCPGCYLAPTHS